LVSRNVVGVPYGGINVVVLYGRTKKSSIMNSQNTNRSWNQNLFNYLKKKHWFLNIYIRNM
jgi:hypothetical protein